MDNWVDRFVGVPYARRGRDYDGCDCYGIVYLVYRDVFNIDLPSYSNRYMEITKDIEKIYQAEMDKWIEVDSPVIGDVLYFRLGGQEIHVGVYIGGGKFIHNLSDNGTSSIADATRNKWKQRLIGYWRYGKRNL